VFHSILVAVDGSRPAARALDQAVELARSEGARLTLITVVEPPCLRGAAGPFIVPIVTEAQLAREAERVLARAEALVPDGIPVTTVIRRGPADEAILDRIEAAEHDLVVMGSHGRGLLGSLLLGSTSKDVVARSPVPVLVVRETRERGHQGVRPQAGDVPAATSRQPTGARRR
jgi:nucleotide-binding universal stress UspA family protein